MSSIVIGPWPGSNPHRVTPGKPEPRNPVPHRYQVGPHGPVVLMDCRECRTPFHPDVEVPRDRLCADCRAAAAEAAPSLFGVDDLADGELPKEVPRGT